MRRGVAVSSMAVALMVLFAMPAAAATKTPVTFVDCIVSEGQPERLWVSEDDTLHIRGQVIETEIVSGDLTGSFIIDLNVNLDLSTGHGNIFGPLVLATPEETWEGRFTGTIAPTGFSGRFVAQGSEGTKIMATFVQTSPACFANEGTILDPHG